MLVSADHHTSYVIIAALVLEGGRKVVNLYIQ